MNTMNHGRTRSQSGFTLIEIGVVLAIIGLLAAIAVPSVPFFLRKGRVSGVIGSVKSIEGWVGSLQSSSAAGGTLPITEGAAPPLTGAALAAQAPAATAAAARLDMAIVAAGIADKLPTFTMGNQNFVPGGTGADLVWNTKLRAFMMENTAVPGSPSATLTAGRDWSNCSRLESRISNPALAPSAAVGANFRLNGTANMSANTIVAYVIIKDAPYKDALELSRQINGEDLTTASEGSTTAQDAGQVAFAAPAAGTATTDVYIYVSSI